MTAFNTGRPLPHRSFAVLVAAILLPWVVGIGLQQLFGILGCGRDTCILGGDELIWLRSMLFGVIGIFIIFSVFLLFIVLPLYLLAYAVHGISVLIGRSK